MPAAFAIGDIVEVAGRAGVFVVWCELTAPAPHLSRRWRVVRNAGHGVREGFEAGDLELTLIARPVFTIGQRLHHGGESVTVVAVGADNVRVRTNRQQVRALAGGGRASFGHGFIEAGRADLVLENLSFFKGSAT